MSRFADVSTSLRALACHRARLHHRATQKLRAGLRIGLCLGAALWTTAGTALAAEPIPLRLIGINDLHGNLEPSNLNLVLPDPAAPGEGKTVRVAAGGVAALSGLVQTLRAGAPNSLLLSAGDLVGASPLVSTLFKHESTIEAMNRLGLEVGIVGNHEFDGGLAELKRLAVGGCADTAAQAAITSCALGRHTGARFPLLAANVVDAQGKPVFEAYVIKRYGGVKVGVIGAITRDTPNVVVPSNIAGLRFTDEAEAVNRAAKQLRARGVKAIVAVFHEGGELGTPQKRGDWNDTQCPDAHGPIFEIAKRLSADVGVIFSAHSHQGYRCIVDGRVIIQGTSYGRGVSVVDVAIDPKTKRFVPSRTTSYNLPVFNARSDAALREKLIAATPAPYAEALRQAKPDEAMAGQVARYTALVAPKSDREVGRIGERFGRSTSAQAGDTQAGRLIADAQLAATQDASRGAAQIAFMNPGGIRSDLECQGTPPCAAFGQAFTMQPFGNGLVVMSLSGAQLKTLLEAQQKPSAPEPSFLQPSAGFSYEWHDRGEDGEHVREMRLNGEPVQPQQSYRVTVNSFLAEGGDGYTVLAAGTERLSGGQDIDALLAYLGAATREPSGSPRVTRMP